jgi:hypothetical protein
MKKYTVFLAIVALVLASLACQTIMGGADSGVPDVQESDDFDSSTPEEDGDTDFGTSSESEFSMTSDAYNVVAADNVLTYQTKLTAEEVATFYREDFEKQGYSEDTSMSVTFGGNFTMVFTGHESGQSIYVVGADAGDGSLFVTITLQ